MAAKEFAKRRRSLGRDVGIATACTSRFVIEPNCLKALNQLVLLRSLRQENLRCFLAMMACVAQNGQAVSGHSAGSGSWSVY